MQLPKYLYKFIIVSLLNTAVDVGVFNILFWAINNKGSLFIFIMLKSVSFFLAVTHSYFWNSAWTFRDEAGYTGAYSIRRFSGFLSVNLLALVVNILAASLVFTLLQILVPAGFYTANTAVISGSMAGMLFNFHGYKRIFLAKKNLVS